MGRGAPLARAPIPTPLAPRRLLVLLLPLFFSWLPLAGRRRAQAPARHSRGPAAAALATARAGRRRGEDAGSGGHGVAAGRRYAGGPRRHFADAAARDHDPRLVPAQHLKQAGSESDTLPLHHHHLPVRIRILLHHTHVAAQSASQTEALPQTVCKAPAFGFDPHAWKCFHQYEFGQGGCLLHAHHQGHGTFLLGPPLCPVPRSGNWLVHTLTPSLLVLGSLVPIVGGVVLASMTEVSFNWIGFWSAMASNLTNQSWNVYSKKILADKEDSLDDINLFSIITVMAFLLSAPLMLSVEGIKFSPSYLQNAGVNVKELCVRAALAGTCFYFYQQVSYSLLARVSPVTHSVANSLKRVVVIVSSVLFFRTPISPINALGTGVALAGVFLYSQFKKLKPKTKAA
ncbi:uncharacterized protein [Miscanthus floridulus]|uniref:uncharacterized protein isoform X1 n=1 Tax=Miscanthus floridulus TaxID=154761 RepID=UPI00345ACEBF